MPHLPYKADLRYTPHHDRPAPCGELVEASPTAIYVKSNRPELDGHLQAQLLDLGVNLEEGQISSCHVYDGLLHKLRPAEPYMQPGE